MTQESSVIAALTGLAALVFLDWWLFSIDWRLGTAFVLIVVTMFIQIWTALEDDEDDR